MNNPYKDSQLDTTVISIMTSSEGIESNVTLCCVQGWCKAWWQAWEVCVMVWALPCLVLSSTCSTWTSTRTQDRVGMTEGTTTHSDIRTPCLRWDPPVKSYTSLLFHLSRLLLKILFNRSLLSYISVMQTIVVTIKLLITRLPEWERVNTKMLHCKTKIFHCHLQHFHFSTVLIRKGFRS